MDGTANADQMQNYYTRTIEPIVTRIKEEFQRKFITKTGYTQGHRIDTYSNPFKLVPTGQLATIGDSLLRNRILTSNEFRAIIGYGPIEDPMADQLFNPNISDARQDVSLPGSVGSLKRRLTLITLLSIVKRIFKMAANNNGGKSWNE